MNIWEHKALLIFPMNSLEYVTVSRITRSRDVLIQMANLLSTKVLPVYTPIDVT